MEANHHSTEIENTQDQGLDLALILVDHIATALMKTKDTEVSEGHHPEIEIETTETNQAEDDLTQAIRQDLDLLHKRESKPFLKNQDSQTQFPISHFLTQDLLTQYPTSYLLSQSRDLAKFMQSQTPKISTTSRKNQLQS